MITRRVDWATIKQFAQDKNVSIQYVDFGNEYELVAVDGAFIITSVLDKEPTDTTELDDFETNFKPAGNAKIDLNTYTSNELNVTTVADGLIADDQLPVTVVSANCPTLTGSKWRTEQSNTEVNISTGSYTVLKSLTDGVLHSIVLDFSTDKMDVKFVVDGQEIFDIDLDDLEDNQGGSSNGAAGSGGIMFVKTGSKFCFSPPCGLKYSNLTISAKSNQNNKKLSGYLIHYSVD